GIGAAPRFYYYYPPVASKRFSTRRRPGIHPGKRRFRPVFHVRDRNPGKKEYASISDPYLRPIEEFQRRRHGAPFGLGFPAPRSRPFPFHRFARSLRHHPDRVPSRALLFRSGHPPPL